MRIWLVQTGEPLPSDGPDVRLLRTGILADILAARGHEVTWWASTFDHTRKRHRAKSTQTLQSEAGYRVVAMEASGYRRNVSVARLWDHGVVGRRFRDLIAGEPRPDVILCSMPTIELAAAQKAQGAHANTWRCPSIMATRLRHGANRRGRACRTRVNDGETGAP